MDTLRFLYLGGSAKERGETMGTIYAGDIRRRCEQARIALGEGDNAEIFHCVREKATLRWPEAVSEIQGRAKGAGVDFDEYFFCICYEITAGGGGCTDVISAGDGRVLLAHNEDDNYTLENFGLMMELTDRRLFAYGASPDALAGATFGWSQTLIHSMNYIDVKHPNRTGLPTWFVVNDLVRSAGMDEVLCKLDGLSDLAGAFNLNLVDTVQKRAWSIERYLDETSVVEYDGSCLHTNHMLRVPVREEDVPKPGESSLFRQSYVEAALAELPGAPGEVDMLRILSHRGADDGDSVLKLGDAGGGLTAVSVLFDSDADSVLLRCRLDGRLYRVHRQSGRVTEIK